MLSEASKFARRGIPVFPCVPGAKRPLTPRGFHDASTDPADLCRWWADAPAANLAIPTGMRSGLLVIDLDVKHGADGFATLRALERDLDALPATSTVRTPSGGEHRYFRAPLEVAIRNSAGRLAGEAAPGFDVRGEGGYVLVPPSQVNGADYVWTHRARAADLPERWRAALGPPPREGSGATPWEPQSGRERDKVRAWCLRALQDEARALAATREGARNDRLWRAAAALGGLVHTGALDASGVRRALAWACATWRTRSLRKDADTLERGLAFGVAHPRRIELGESRDGA